MSNDLKNALREWWDNDHGRLIENSLDRIEELEAKLKQAYINVRDYSNDPALVAWAKVSLKSL